MPSSITDNAQQVAAYNCTTDPAPFTGSEVVNGINTGYKLDGSGVPIVPPNDGYEQQNLDAALYEQAPHLYDGAEHTFDSVKTDLGATDDQTAMVFFMLQKTQMPSGVHNWNVGFNADLGAWAVRLDTDTGNHRRPD